MLKQEMETKIKTPFTTGPWKHVKDKIGFSTADFITCNGRQSGLTHIMIGQDKYGFSTKESEANARLIALSPEMFHVFLNVFIHAYIIGQVPGELQKKCISIIEEITQKKFFDILKEYGEEK